MLDFAIFLYWFSFRFNSINNVERTAHCIEMNRRTALWTGFSDTHECFNSFWNVVTVTSALNSLKREPNGKKNKYETLVKRRKMNWLESISSQTFGAIVLLRDLNKAFDAHLFSRFQQSEKLSFAYLFTPSDLAITLRQRLKRLANFDLLWSLFLPETNLMYGSVCHRMI